MLPNGKLHPMAVVEWGQPYLSVCKATDRAGTRKSARLALRLGASIAERRKACGWTQAALAERVGVDTETISRFERGATLPSLLTLEKLGDCLRVRVGELLTESSTQLNDQTPVLSAWLADLDERDRDFVLDLVKRTCDHLRRE